MSAKAKAENSLRCCAILLGGPAERAAKEKALMQATEKETAAAAECRDALDALMSAKRQLQASQKKLDDMGNEKSYLECASEGAAAADSMRLQLIQQTRELMKSCAEGAEAKDQTIRLIAMTDGRKEAAAGSGKEADMADKDANNTADMQAGPSWA